MLGIRILVLGRQSVALAALILVDDGLLDLVLRARAPTLVILHLSVPPERIYPEDKRSDKPNGSSVSHRLVDLPATGTVGALGACLG